MNTEYFLCQTYYTQGGSTSRRWLKSGNSLIFNNNNDDLTTGGSKEEIENRLSQILSYATQQNFTAQNLGQTVLVDNFGTRA